jgi:hypothetical protein
MSSEDQGIDLTIEQILAAILKTVGKVVVTKETFLSDYTNANIKFQELSENTVAIELTFLEETNDNGTTSEVNA